MCYSLFINLISNSCEKMAVYNELNMFTQIGVRDSGTES